MAPKVTASTQEHLDIYTIKDGYLILKHGGAAAVITTSAVNFDLLSEREQDAAIAAYSDLLNSLSFTTEVVIRSKKMDITDYLKKIKDREERETNPKIKRGLHQYRSFINDLLTKNEVLDKNFYIVIPLAVAAAVARTGPAGFIEKFIRGQTTVKVRVNVEEVLKQAKTQIEPKIEHIVKGLARIGIRAEKLGTQELVELFYDIYNPESAREQKPETWPEYETPIVEPKLAESVGDVASETGNEPTI